MKVRGLLILRTLKALISAGLRNVKSTLSIDDATGYETFIVSRKGGLSSGGDFAFNIFQVEEIWSSGKTLNRAVVCACAGTSTTVPTYL